MSGPLGLHRWLIKNLDKPMTYGAAWGELNSNIHRALGVVGGIIDGAIRDLDEMNNAGFKALARRLAVGHGHATPVRWNCEVEVFGRKVLPGQLILRRHQASGSASSTSVQTEADRFGQSLGKIGFGQEIDPFAQFKVLAE